MSESCSIAIEARDLHKTYTDGVKTLTILRGASLKVHARELIVIMGRSGCGKSTLLHLLGLLDRPDKGSIHFAGMEKEAGTLSDVARTRLRKKHIGFIFQNYPLLPDFNALENVMAAIALANGGGFCRANRKKAEECLAMVDLTERLKMSPQTLSGGERQRTAIARAFASDPKVILADEPTGSLDSETGAGVMALLRKIVKEKGTAAVIVTHDEKIAEGADKVMRMEEGILC